MTVTACYTNHSHSTIKLMQIGFDLDKVFIDSPPLIPSRIIEKFYKKRDNGILQYRIPSYPEQLFRKSLHFPALRQPIKKNLALLRNISKKDNKIYLISSRYKFLEEITNKLIKKHNLDEVFDGLYFNYENKQPHLFKEDVLKKLKLDMYIDDDLSLLKHVAKENPQTKFFWLSRGKIKQTLPNNIFQIEHLAEAFRPKT